MIKLIQRKTDNKYLQSVETDSWVNNVADAFEMTYRECETAKAELLNTYTSDQIKEVVNMRKSKPISDEEKKELLDIIKKNKP
jgi:hypothetical protein